jgi:hypothetical protein
LRIALLLILVAQFGLGCGNFPAAWKDKKEILAVTRDFVRNFGLNSLEGTMKHISSNYNEGCRGCGYEYFKSRYSGIFSDISRSVVDGSCRVSRISGFKLNPDKAGFDLVYSCSGYSKTEAKIINVSFFKIVRMEKEKGTWKIVSFKYDEEGNLALCKNTITQFIAAVIAGRAERAGRYISAGYSGREGDEVIDYQKFIARLRRSEPDEFLAIKKYSCADFSVESFRFIHDKDVLVNIVLRCAKGSSAGNDMLMIKRQISLVKENKEWKINSWRVFPESRPFVRPEE